ncbi:MAG: hypothetical protein CRN43_22535 [Candidatus Nephrothrix sp. EaCA]|nr:MAG: hypothetical protein CRN43_22535 [Candidatus Nephrothrix sp. EaCA]
MFAPPIFETKIFAPPIFMTSLRRWLPPIISLIAVGSTMGLFRGEVYGFKAPKINFLLFKS